MNWPSVTCTTPTYGRFSRLRDAIACFLMQDYPGHKHMAISNDAPIPLQLTSDGNILAIGDKTTIVVTNWPERFVNLGRKRQQQADTAETDLIAHWDDDDLCLPWHLSTRIKIFAKYPDLECVKLAMGWRIEGPPHNFTNIRWQHRRYDGQMVFKTGTNVEYVDGTRSVPIVLVYDYVARGKIWCEEEPMWSTSFVFRIKDGMCHLSRTGRNHKRAGKNFARRNLDFGKEPLLPSGDLHQWARDHMRDQFHRLIETWAGYNKMKKEDLGILTERLLTALKEN